MIILFTSYGQNPDNAYRGSMARCDELAWLQTHIPELEDEPACRLSEAARQSWPGPSPGESYIVDRATGFIILWSKTMLQ